MDSAKHNIRIKVFSCGSYRFICIGSRHPFCYKSPQTDIGGVEHEKYEGYGSLIPLETGGPCNVSRAGASRIENTAF
jgi:hypothetical protein